MRILVTNDDGIDSEGLWSLAAALADIGRVSVVAPDRDNSGISAAITITNVVRARTVESPVPGIDATSVQGTPADCAILAIESLYDERFDLVVSGINHGANLGLDVLSSGTVGAAMQGSLRGIPAIAVSVASLADVAFEAAARTARAIAGAVAQPPVPAGSGPAPLVNVNLPNVLPDQVLGVCAARLGPRAYLEGVTKDHDGRRTHYWIRHNREVGADAASDTDVYAVRNGWAAISPVTWGTADTMPQHWLQHLAQLAAEELGVEAASDAAPRNDHRTSGPNRQHEAAR